MCTRFTTEREAESFEKKLNFGLYGTAMSKCTGILLVGWQIILLRNGFSRKVHDCSPADYKCAKGFCYWTLKLCRRIGDLTNVAF